MNMLLKYIMCMCLFKHRCFYVCTCLYIRMVYIVCIYGCMYNIVWIHTIERERDPLNLTWHKLQVSCNNNEPSLQQEAGCGNSKCMPPAWWPQGGLQITWIVRHMWHTYGQNDVILHLYIFADVLCVSWKFLLMHFIIRTALIQCAWLSVEWLFI